MKTVKEGSFCKEKVQRVHFVEIVKGIIRFDWQVVGYTYVHVVRMNWKQRIKLFLIRLLLSRTVENTKDILLLVPVF